MRQVVCWKNYTSETGLEFRSSIFIVLVIYLLHVLNKN